MQADPIDTQMDAALEYSRVLAEVEREIADAFKAHFAGKPGQYVPKVKLVRLTPARSVDTVIGESAQDAIEFIHDYREILPVFHAVIRGQRPIADYQHAIIKLYMELHASEVAEVRSGIEGPVRYVAPEIPKFLAEAL